MNVGHGMRRNLSVGVGALVFDTGGLILLGHRIKDGEPATWCLPGGHLEPGETPEQAAVREIAEETGVDDVREPRAFAMAVNAGAAGGITIGVIARSEAAALGNGEPEIFDRWIWADPNALPTPLFSATEMLVAAWRNCSCPPDWTVYSIGSPEAAS